jgi:AcrR family transcriptional regulator
VIDGALGCIARQGVAKTTLDDVARQAGCSRATVYRAFPGGKDAVLGAVVDTEVSRFFSALAVRMGEASDIEEVLVAGMSEAAAQVTGHAALGYLLRHEPEVVLPQLAFARMDEVLAVTCAFTVPFLGRWLDAAESRRVAEWSARIVVSYLACPAEGVDLTDPEHVRRLVRVFVLPGIRALATREAAAPARRAGTGNRHRGRTESEPSDTVTKGEVS